MRNTGRTKLGHYPLPLAEAQRLRLLLEFPEQFAAVDPCVGDGSAFTCLLDGANAFRHGIEIDADRTQQARARDIQVVQGDALDVRCPAESLSLLYLNPPYDFEIGATDNRRLEAVFLEHCYRWLKQTGVLVFIIPQAQLKRCARLLAEHFVNLRVYRLTEPECVQYQQVAVVAARRRRQDRLNDDRFLDMVRFIEGAASAPHLLQLTDTPDAKYPLPSSGPTTLTHVGILLDEVEDHLLESAAYRQASRIFMHQPSNVRGRPLTPLHGGHVGLLCTAGMLNGVFGEGEQRHIAHWRSVKYIDHWEEEEEDHTRVVHDRERFSHELTLIFADGRTEVLTHERKQS